MKTDKNIKSASTLITAKSNILWGALVVITLFSSLVIHPEQGKLNYNYKAGDIAERDIKAPRDFFIEDQNATLINRQQTADSFKSIYDYDPNMASQLSEKIEQAFAVPRKLFLSRPSLELVMSTLKDFENILGIDVGEKSYSALYKYNFSNEISDHIKTILTEIFKNGVVANKELLLKEDKKGIILREIGSSAENVVENLKIFYGPDEAQNMVKEIVEKLPEIDKSIKNIVIDILQKLILPNITMNRNETESRIAEAQSEIKPVLYQIKKGEMILREGERVDDTKIVKLKALAYQLQEKNIVMRRIGTALMIMFALLVIYNVFIKNNKKLSKHHNKNILFLSIMLIIFLSITRISIPPIEETASIHLPFNIVSDSLFLILPIAAGAMTVSLFLGFEIALYFTLILSIISSTIFSSRIEVFIFFFLSSIIGAFWMKECKERKIFITTGVKLALFNSGLAIALNVYSADIDIIILVKNIMLASLNGLISGIITAGLTPIVEILFSYTTEIKYLELSNLDQPVMKRLMIEAPGTYNHSVIVSNLAEAAASAIGVSALRTKVGAFYHDIGKLDKPLYFIENQTDGRNRHDNISPSMSALVLIQHTKKGVEIARDNKLGQEIMDTIQQHHGTSLIRYFYNKSIKINGPDAVKESDFRYPGPKPQTRESAIVMLADVVEAALRTLERPTSARIQGRVQELINAIFLDGQLEECELTLKDLHQIAKSFTTILTGLYHHRIEYNDKTIEVKKENKAQENKTTEVKKENKAQENKTTEVKKENKSQENKTTEVKKESKI